MSAPTGARVPYGGDRQRYLRWYFATRFDPPAPAGYAQWADQVVLPRARALLASGLPWEAPEWNVLLELPLYLAMAFDLGRGPWARYVRYPGGRAAVSLRVAYFQMKLPAVVAAEDAACIPTRGEQP